MESPKIPLVVKDNINPNHYKKTGKKECIDIVEEFTKDLQGVDAFCMGNVIKYLYRFQDKNGKEDLQKAQWYLDRLVKHLYSNEDYVDPYG